MTAPVAPANPFDALLTELIPSRPETAHGRGPWSKAEQDAHWNALCETVGDTRSMRPQSKAGR